MAQHRYKMRKFWQWLKKSNECWFWKVFWLTLRLRILELEKMMTSLPKLTECSIALLKRNGAVARNQCSLTKCKWLTLPRDRFGGGRALGPWILGGWCTAHQHTHPNTQCAHTHAHTVQQKHSYTEMPPKHPRSILDNFWLGVTTVYILPFSTLTICDCVCLVLCALSPFWPIELFRRSERWKCHAWVSSAAGYTWAESSVLEILWSI